MTDTITMGVNPQRLLANFKYTFSSNTTFITELIQNARRSGASHIRMAVTDNEDDTCDVVVQDDGKGVTDFAELISLGESGWDADLAEAEHPFGMGFLAAILAGEDITVSSHGHKINADQQTFLDQGRVQIRPNDKFVDGTLVMLLNVGVKAERVRQRIEQSVKGLSIPALLDGQALARPHAVGDDVIELDIGVLVNPDPARTASPVCYLIEQPVLNNELFTHVRARGKDTALHLDPKQFAARLPDRDSLIDPDVAQRRVTRSVRYAMVERLRQIKAGMDVREFADEYATTLEYWGALDLLNDIDSLPGHFLSTFDYDWVMHHENQASYAVSKRASITRADVASGRHPVVTYGDFDELQNLNDRVYAHTQGAAVLTRALDPGHWIYAHALDLNNHSVTAEVIQPTRSVEFDTEHGRITIAACHSAILHGPWGTTEPVNTLPVASKDEQTVYLFPHKAMGGTIDCILSFFDPDNEIINDDELERAAIDVNRVLESLRHDSLSSLLTSTINDMMQRAGNDLPGADRTYQVAFVDGRAQVTEH